MESLHASVEVEAPIERVFAYVTDPENMPRVWRSMASVSTVERRPDGAHSYDWVHKMGALNVRGHAETAAVEPNRSCTVKSKGGISSTMHWTFEPRGLATHLSVDVDYAVPAPIVGRIAEKVLAKHTEREMNEVLGNVKGAVESEARAAAGAVR
jgi:uncharacterized membrane protein